MKQTNTQCWIRITGRAQEYWRSKILFAIVRGVGIPLSLDDATINKTFGHYTRILVDTDLINPIQDQILVEREGFAFLVWIDYEFLLCFCSTCVVIGHSLSDCKKIMNFNKGAPKNDNQAGIKKSVQRYFPKSVPVKEIEVDADKDNSTEIDLNKGKEIIDDRSPRVMLQGESGKQDQFYDNEHPALNVNQSSFKDNLVHLDHEIVDIPVKVMKANSFLPDDVPFVDEKIDDIVDNQNVRPAQVSNLDSHVSKSQENDLHHIDVGSDLNTNNYDADNNHDKDFHEEI